MSGCRMSSAGWGYGVLAFADTPQDENPSGFDFQWIRECCFRNVHPDHTTVRSTSQVKSLENKGPTGFNPWGAYVFSMEARGVEPLS